MNTIGNPTAHMKKFDGHVCLSVRIPHSYEVEAIWETYTDKKGKPFQQEDYEYGVNDVLEYNANEHAKEIMKDIEYLKSRGWSVEEIEIEEC